MAQEAHWLQTGIEEACIIVQKDKRIGRKAVLDLLQDVRKALGALCEQRRCVDPDEMTLVSITVQLHALSRE